MPKLGALGDAIDDAAAAAAAENHRIGALEHLDPVDVVEVAEILDVVADAVDEEVGGGVVAAQGELVAVALAGAGVAPGTKVSSSATERIDWSSICFSEMTVSACGMLRMSVFVLVAVLVDLAPYSGALAGDDDRRLGCLSCIHCRRSPAVAARAPHFGLGAAMIAVDPASGESDLR